MESKGPRVFFVAQLFHTKEVMASQFAVGCRWVFRVDLHNDCGTTCAKFKVANWHHMGVEPKIGGNPPKWMVKIMENPIKMDDLGVPLFLETPIS